MMNHKLANLAGALASLSLVALIAGCGGEPEPEPVAIKPKAAPAPPPPPPPPAVKSVADLMIELNIDERVSLPESLAPPTTEQRIAVLEFFDGFARGDDQSLSSMMRVPDQMELQALVDSGVWDETVEDIEEIDVETGVNGLGQNCALALITVDGEIQPQMWYYQTSLGEPKFDAAKTPPNMMDKLYGSDLIARWEEILAEELALATTPDENLFVPQLDLDEEDRSGRATSTGTAAPSPGGPGVGRRPRPANPRPAPRPG